MRVPVTPADVPPWGPAEALTVATSILSGRIRRGGAPARLEELVGQKLGVRNVKALNSCRAAMTLALRGFRIGSGDEVVLPSYLCESALDPVLRVGASPRFVDCGPDLQMSVPAVERAITARTRAILAPHLFGNSIEIERLEALVEGTDIVLLDDAAQSFGATRSGRHLGTFGSCGVTSCDPSKPLSGSGGGLLITTHSELAEGWGHTELGTEPAWRTAQRVLRLWIWLRYGRWTARFKRPRAAGDTRSHRLQCRSMAHLDAAVAILQLDLLGDGEKRRLAWSLVAGALRDRLAGEVLEASQQAVPRNVVALLDQEGPSRAEVLERFREVGVQARAGYSPLHLSGDHAHDGLPVTEHVWPRVIVVPIGEPSRTAEALRGL